MGTVLILLHELFEISMAIIAMYTFITLLPTYSIFFFVIFNYNMYFGEVIVVEIDKGIISFIINYFIGFQIPYSFIT